MPIRQRRKPQASASTSQPYAGLRSALLRARAEAKPEKSYAYPIKPPELMSGVIPAGVKVPVLTADDSCYSYSQAMGAGVGYGSEWVGFPGYPYLSMLSTRAEYRMFAQAMSNAITREWLKLGSTNGDTPEIKEKIVQLEKDLDDLDLKEIVAQMVDHDSFYGRAQLFLDIKSQTDRMMPLVLDPRTVKKQAIKEDEKINKYFTVKAVEAMWTTPQAYNADDPTREDFYRPVGWYMLGKQVHADRLLTVVTRPVTDMLKPAFNFGGMSISQLAEPYVDNWLRTRQSVSDLINNFSIVTMKTQMAQVLQGGSGIDVDNLYNRAELFTLTRNNKGLMLLDMTNEDLVVQNVPLGGLAELQSASQEQMCSVSHIPAVELLGVSPTGFGNLAEGEMKSFKDWIRSLQYRDWSWVVTRVLEIVQLIRYGSIDPGITVNWQPLYQMTPKELAELRKSDAERDVAYVGAGILADVEVREKLARNADSGYEGLDVENVPEVDNEDLEEQDVP